MRAFGPAVLRVSLAAVFIIHGAEKLFGFWGGGLGPTAEFVASLGLKPAYPLAVAAAATELAGGILLLAGAFTLWTALALALGRAAVVYKAYSAAGAIIRATQPGRDEFDISVLVLGALIALMLMGPGAVSIDERRERSAERAAFGRARARKV